VNIAHYRTPFHSCLVSFEKAMTVLARRYVFDAVPLLDDCIDKLQKTIDQDSQGHHDALYDMKEVLVSTERLLHKYLALEIEKKDLTAGAHKDASSTSIMGTMAALKEVLEKKQRQEELHNRRIRFRNPQDPIPVQNHSYYNTGRSATDTLLFRLIVALQLCLVRIDDAHFVLTGRRIGVSTTDEQKVGRRLLLLTGCCLVCAGVSLRHQQGGRELRLLPKGVDDSSLVLGALAKIGTTLVVGTWVKSKLNAIWITAKIIQSTNEIEEWIKQWQVVQSTVPPQEKVDEMWLAERSETSAPSQTTTQSQELMDDKSRRLIEYAMRHSRKVPCL
jgi:hypothetical protein